MWPTCRSWCSHIGSCDLRYLTSRRFDRCLKIIKREPKHGIWQTKKHLECWNFSPIFTKCPYVPLNGLNEPLCSLFFYRIMKPWFMLTLPTLSSFSGSFHHLKFHTFSTKLMSNTVVINFGDTLIQELSFPSFVVGRSRVTRPEVVWD